MPQEPRVTMFHVPVCLRCRMGLAYKSKVDRSANVSVHSTFCILLLVVPCSHLKQWLHPDLLLEWQKKWCHQKGELNRIDPKAWVDLKAHNSLDSTAKSLECTLVSAVIFHFFSGLRSWMMLDACRKWLTALNPCCFDRYLQPERKHWGASARKHKAYKPRALLHKSTWHSYTASQETQKTDARSEVKSWRCGHLHRLCQCAYVFCVCSTEGDNKDVCLCVANKMLPRRKHFLLGVFLAHPLFLLVLLLLTTSTSSASTTNNNPTYTTPSPSTFTSTTTSRSNTPTT